MFFVYSYYIVSAEVLGFLCQYLLLEKSKNSHKEWKDVTHLGRNPVPLSLQKFPAVTAAIYEARSHVAHMRSASLLVLVMQL